jgi:hypothetical protein
LDRTNPAVTDEAEAKTPQVTAEGRVKGKASGDGELEIEIEGGGRSGSKEIWMKKEQPKQQYQKSQSRNHKRREK